MSRAANRAHTDLVAAAALERVGEWLYFADLAEELDLKKLQVQAAAWHLYAEYGAGEFRPISKAWRITDASELDVYCSGERRYHPARLGEYER